MVKTHKYSSQSFCFRLSGESPFQGNSDAETLALVTAAQWEFDEESFEDITEEAQNFISSLLNKDPRSFHKYIAKTLPQTPFFSLMQFSLYL